MDGWEESSGCVYCDLGIPEVDGVHKEGTVTVPYVCLNWAKHQVPAPLETELAIENAVREGRIGFADDTDAETVR